MHLKKDSWNQIKDLLLKRLEASVGGRAQAGFVTKVDLTVSRAFRSSKTFRVNGSSPGFPAKAWPLSFVYALLENPAGASVYLQGISFKGLADAQ